MNFNKLTNPIQGAKDVAGQVQEQAAGIANAAQDQFNAVLEEYEKIVPIAETLGLTVGKFEVEMGIIPEITTSLVGSVDRIQKDAVEKLIAEYKNNKILVLILNGLLFTKDMQQRLHISNLKGIVVDLKIGLSPSVSVHLAS